MTRFLSTLVAAVVAVFVAIPDTARAQYVEQGDASHIFAEAQFAGSLPIQGSLTQRDADI